jgi:hypothetical protein
MLTPVAAVEHANLLIRALRSVARQRIDGESLLQISASTDRIASPTRRDVPGWHRPGFSEF